MGEGNDVLTVDRLQGASNSRISIDLGSGNNVLNQESTNIRVDHFRYVDIKAGNGKDEITANARIFDSTINLGGGDNTITAKQEINNTTITTGDNVDTFNLGSLTGSTKIESGAGNDVFTITGDILGAQIFTGSGDDVVTMTALAGTSRSDGTPLYPTTLIDLGDGNDTFYYSQTDIGGKVDGGAGIDTFVFTGGKDQQIWGNDTKGFEVFDLRNSGGELNLRYEDLVDAGTKEVFIKGNAGVGNTLDLGSNNAKGVIKDNHGLNKPNMIADYSGNKPKDNETDYWAKQTTSDQAGYDKYVFIGSSSAPNNQGYTVYVDPNVTVI